jgi:hypothetical protein
MEAMDEMFIPYKEMFPVQSPPKATPQVEPKEGGSWNILLLSLLVGLIFAVGFACYFYATKQETPLFRQVDAIPFNSIPKQIDIQQVESQKKNNVDVSPEPEPKVKELKIDVVSKQESKEPKLESPKPEPKIDVPKPEPKIDSTPKKVEVKPEPEKSPEIVEYGNSHELAKGVGTKIRDVLLTHKQIPSLAVASIVSSTVKVLLGENDRPQPSGEQELKVEKEEKVENVEKIEKKEEIKRPRELDDEPTKDTPRRGKINAETDANLLKLLKDRGLKN